MNEAAENLRLYLSKTRLEISRHNAFGVLSPMLQLGGTLFVEDGPFVELDGVTIRINAKWFAVATQPQRRAALLHVAAHVCYQHTFTWLKLFEADPAKAHCACDYLINSMLLSADNGEGFIDLAGLYPKGEMPLNTKWTINQSVVHAFKSLKDGSLKQVAPFDSLGLKFATELSSDDLKNLADSVRREVSNASMAARIKAGMTAGQGAGNGQRINVEGNVAPKLTWIQQLEAGLHGQLAGGRDFTTWSKLSRRAMARGEVRPGPTGKGFGTVVVTIDTSISVVMGKGLQVALTEIQELMNQLKPERVVVIQCDHSVQDIKELSYSEMSTFKSSFSMKGGGGTDLREAFLEVEVRDYQNVEAHIVFTDGETPFPAKPTGYPTYWIIIDTDIIAPFGQSILYDALGE